MNSLIILLLLITLSWCDRPRRHYLFDETPARLSHQNCNGECLTKTYCMSSDGSNVCSEQNLVTATWSLVLQGENFGKFKLTLAGYGVEMTDYKYMELNFVKTQSSFDNSSFFNSTNPGNTPKHSYTCIKWSNGLFLTHVASSQPGPLNGYSSGEPSYSDNVFTCTWFFSRKDYRYPFYYESDIDLVTQSIFQLSLDNGTFETIVATDTSQLPIYRTQLYRWCYTIHGNDEYVIVTNQTEGNSYAVRTFNEKHKELTVLLIASRVTRLLFKCNLQYHYVTATITTYNERHEYQTHNISHLLYDTYVSSTLCKWSHPLELRQSGLQYDTTNRIYDLRITADWLVVFRALQVTLWMRRDLNCSQADPPDYDPVYSPLIRS